MKPRGKGSEARAPGASGQGLQGPQGHFLISPAFLGYLPSLEDDTLKEEGTLREEGHFPGIKSARKGLLVAFVVKVPGPTGGA